MAWKLYTQMGIFSMAKASLKPIIWMGDSKKVICELPKAVRREVGVALFWAEQGTTHPASKPMKGALQGVTEIVSDYDGDTFRAMYTTRIGREIYVLHVFQKKSKRGKETPKPDVDLITSRLKAAKAIHAQRMKKGDKS